MTNVALLTREYPPEVYGGAGVHVDELSRQLAKLLDVTVHCWGDPRPPSSTSPAPAVVAHRAWDQLEGDAPHLAALRALSIDLSMVAAAEGVDLVHSHTWYANLAGDLAARTYRIPHVVTAHSLEPLRPWKALQLGGGYELSSFAERTAYFGADAIIAVSAAMRDDVLRAYPEVDPSRVVVIHNGIDPEVYRPVPDTDTLEQLGIDPTVPTVLFIGRITRQKGVTHLIDAVAHLDPEVQVVLCAGAPDTPEIGAEVRGAVEARRTTHPRLIWVERMLAKHEAVQLLTHAHVFVCPSIYEPMGIVNLEAMACGTAVVASRVGGIPEVVVDGETGLLVDVELDADGSGRPRDPAGFAQDLAAAVTALVDDPHRAVMMGVAGQRRARDQFSWAAAAERTARLYTDVLNRDIGATV